MLRQLDAIMADLKRGAEFVMIEEKDSISYFIDKESKIYRLSQRIGATVKKSFSLKLIDESILGTTRKRIYVVPKITR